MREGPLYKRTFFVVGIAVVPASVAVPPARAQDPPPEPDSIVRLQPLVVTARNREELLQSVPLAVSAFSGLDLEHSQVGTTDLLGQIMPNVNFNHSGALAGTKSAAQFYIRGVGQRDFLPVTDPGVAVYVDGYTCRARWER